MKRCPFCAEEIQDAAIKCRFCGEMLTGIGTGTVNAASVTKAHDISPGSMDIFPGRVIGGLITVFAILMVLWSFGMDVSVSVSGGGRVNNIGLMHQQQMLLIAGIGGGIFGLLLLLLSPPGTAVRLEASSWYLRLLGWLDLPIPTEENAGPSSNSPITGEVAGTAHTPETLVKPSRDAAQPAESISATSAESPPVQRNQPASPSDPIPTLLVLGAGGGFVGAVVGQAIGHAPHGFALGAILGPMGLLIGRTLSPTPKDSRSEAALEGANNPQNFIYARLLAISYPNLLGLLILGFGLFLAYCSFLGGGSSLLKAGAASSITGVMLMLFRPKANPRHAVVGISIVLALIFGVILKRATDHARYERMANAVIEQVNRVKSVSVVNLTDQFIAEVNKLKGMLKELESADEHSFHFDSCDIRGGHRSSRSTLSAAVKLCDEYYVDHACALLPDARSELEAGD